MAKYFLTPKEWNAEGYQYALTEDEIKKLDFGQSKPFSKCTSLGEFATPEAAKEAAEALNA